LPALANDEAARAAAIRLQQSLDFQPPLDFVDSDGMKEWRRFRCSTKS
jgi:hypothetical protein